MRTIVGLLLLAVAGVSSRWYVAAVERDRALADLESAEATIGAAQRPGTRRPAADQITSTTTDDEQAALMLAILTTAQDPERDAELELLRRRVERAEADAKRARAAQCDANDARQALLRERQGLINEASQLREINAAIADEIIKLKAAELRRKGRRL